MASSEHGTQGGKCVELALEGEKRCRSGDTKVGIGYLEAGLAAGTDDLRTLSAIYSQLGNAYFYLGDFLKALEYHRHDLTLARTIGDKLGEAKASGNLGNTLKVLGKFEEAILCCRRHLEISQELADKVGEGRAYYNLGNVFHAKGKHIGRLMCNSSDSGAEFPQEVKSSLLSAVEHYGANLRVVEELGDRAAQGRACGNLGNTHYLLGQFNSAVLYHNKRLGIAKEFGDKPAMRRAYSNLGNAHVFLGDFETAAEYYRKALAIALELGDKATEAQACYSLGNTSTLMGDHAQAVDYHLRHLRIARQLNDRVGQARAAWSLGNAYTALGQHAKALYFVMVHFHLSKEIGDANGESVAEQNLSDLAQILGKNANPDDTADPTPIPVDELVKESGIGDKMAALDRVRRRSMEHVELWRLTPDRKAMYEKKLEKPQCLSMGTESANSQMTQIRPLLSGNTPEDVFDEESFFELLSRVQGKRINDQRCDASTLHENKENRPRVRATDGFRQNMPAVDQNPEEFLEMIAGIQSRRMDDQRASLPFLPGLQNPARVLGPHLEKRKQENVSKTNSGVVPSAGEKPPGAQTKLLKSKSADIAQKASGKSDKKELDDDFYEMLIKCQSTRIEEQRSELPGPSAVKAAPTVPDEDFFQLIMRLQARRFDEQRAALSPSSLKNESSSEETSGPGRGGSSNPNKEVKNTTVNSDQQKPPKRTASQKIKKR